MDTKDSEELLKTNKKDWYQGPIFTSKKPKTF